VLGAQWELFLYPLMLMGRGICNGATHARILRLISDGDQV